MHSEIIKNIFNLLAISTSVAAFLPALVYSYYSGFTIKMIDNIRNRTYKITNEDHKNKVETIVGFSLSLDLILSMIIFLILFTSLSNLMLYIFTKNAGLYLLIIINILWFLYLIFSLYLWRHSFEVTKSISKHWKFRKRFIHITFLTMIAYSLIELILSLILSCGICKGCSVDIKGIELWMVSTSTIMIIISSISWIFPLFIYRPLFTEIKEAVIFFEETE